MAVFDGDAGGGGETSFYAQCLKHLVFEGARPPARVVEFGPGSGSAVIAALASKDYPTSVLGVEIDEESVDCARTRIADAHLEGQYAVTLGDFFSRPPEADCLVANPPFLPTVDEGSALAGEVMDPKTRAMLPQCDGGPTGSELSQRLLKLHYAQVMMLVCSFVNPIATFDTAREHGYSVSTWLARPGRLGGLARWVFPTIRELQSRQQAFFLRDSEVFLMCGVLWSRSEQTQVSDAERSLVACMKGLQR